MLRRLLKMVLGMVVASAVLAGMNGLAWLGERLAYGAAWKDGGPEGLYRPRSARPQLVPGAKLDGLLYRVHVNGLGFRGMDIRLEKPDPGLRVWIVGGSTTFDIYARDDRSAWPALVQGRLEAATPVVPVEVINAGIPSATLEHNRADLIDLYSRVEPDILVIHHGPNDLREVALDEVPPQPDRWRMDLALMRVLVRALPPPRARAEWAQRRMDEARLVLVRRGLLELVRDATRLEMAIVLASHAHRAEDDATGERAARQVGEGAALYQMSPEAVIAMFAAYNQMVAEVARTHALAFADVRAAVPTHDSYWGDATHVTAMGSHLIAECVTDAILKDKLHTVEGRSAAVAATRATLPEDPHGGKHSGPPGRHDGKLESPASAPGG